MKRYALSLVALAGLFVLAGGSVALADGPGTTTLVPFDFTAGARKLPAGTYAVTRLDSPTSIIEIRSRGTGLFLASHEETSVDTSGKPRLVFHRYGDRYFLREVWMSGGHGYPLHAPAAERQLVEAQRSAPTLVTVEIAESR